MRSDLRLAARALRGAPAFTVATILSLALGVAVNGPIFAVLDSVLLRAPPYRDPADLVTLQDATRVPDYYLLTFDEYQDVASASRTLDPVAAYRAGMGYRYALHLDGASAEATGMAVSTNLFATLGVGASLGRVFQPDDGRPDATPVVVLGNNLWHRAFAADTAILGTTVRIDQRRYVVIGVMPANFWFPDWDIEFWTPLSPVAEAFPRGERSISLIARRRGGIAVSSVRAELAGFGNRLDQAAPAERGRRWWRVVPFSETTRPGDLRLVVVLQLVGAVVLLLACINVSSLLLIRASVRQRASALRIALGASRWQRARPLVAEALLLALGVTITGGALSLVSLHLMLANVRRSGLAEWIEGAPVHTLLFVMAAAAVALAFSCAVPGVQLLRRDERLALAEASAASGFGAAGRRTRGAAVAIQLALSIALVASAALLVFAVQRSTRWTPGFPTAGLLTVSLERDQPGRQAANGGDILTRLAAVPGVRHVALGRRIRPEEDRIIADSRAEAHECACQAVTADFLTTLGIQVVRGRDFSRTADAGGPPVAIVDARLARAMWNTTDVVGRRLKLGEHAPWLTIIGVSAPVDFSRPSADRGVPPEPALYTLVPADSGVPGTIFLRTGTKAPPASMAGAILAITTPGLEHASAGAMRPMDQVLNASLEPIERYARLLGALSGLALVLALIGMYGVLAYHVASHQRELGIRAAIGAAPRTLIGHVARDAGVLLLLGIVPGVGLSMVSGRVLAALVLGGNDSIVGPLLMAVAVTIAGCAVATLPPALRAARIAPAEVLRDQAR